MFANLYYGVVIVTWRGTFEIDEEKDPQDDWNDDKKIKVKGVSLRQWLWSSRCKTRTLETRVFEMMQAAVLWWTGGDRAQEGWRTDEGLTSVVRDRALILFFLEDTKVIDYIDIDAEAWWTNKELILVCSDGGARWLERDQRISEDEISGWQLRLRFLGRVLYNRATPDI